ncbi:hypothetical protein [Streptomyces sp. NPDC046631]|uniref:hypothetical protein n=1 Tax=unclassified Streptomyces TaxID=2593676 RepID=UPI0033E4E408
MYRFQAEVQPPNMYILRQALIERLDRTDPEAGMFGFIAVNQLAGMFSVGLWEPVRESEARSGVRLWAGRPGNPPSVHGQVVRSDKAATSGEAAVPGARPWHAILADTPDLGSWSTRTRTRHLELGYQGGSSPHS